MADVQIRGGVADWYWAADPPTLLLAQCMYKLYYLIHLIYFHKLDYMVIVVVHLCGHNYSYGRIGGL